VVTRLIVASVLLASLLHGGVAEAAAEAGRISVGRTAVVTDESVTLADVATLEGEAAVLGTVVLGPAPAPGASRGIDGRMILRRLRAAGFDGETTRYVIPATVRVSRAAQEIAAAEIEAAVEQAAPALLGPGERLRSLEVAGPTRVAVGAYDLRVAPPPPTRGAQRRFDVEVLMNERVVATTAVRARIDASGPVVVTRRPVARGALVQAGDLVVEERDLGNAPASVVTSVDQAVGMEARVPLAAGTPLTFRALERPLLVRRGDVISLIVETPGMRISVAGEAREPGAAGDAVRVLNRKSQQELSGRVVDRGIVLVQY
jgi:flagella basal body P-ring formation protein FlgA